MKQKTFFKMIVNNLEGSLSFVIDNINFGVACSFDVQPQLWVAVSGKVCTLELIRAIQ